MKNNRYVLFKRFVDIVLSILIIVALFPLLLIVFVLIKIEGEGSPIFRQERLGMDSKPFMILKFRSMKNSAPNVAASEFRNDDYITKVGKFIRKTSIDELPQLFNILKGEMSFVGPRPLIPTEGLILDLRREYHVDKLRPGLTGYAQVEARDTIDQEKKFKLDLYYLENFSMKLDIEILFRTLFSLDGK